MKNSQEMYLTGVIHILLGVLIAFFFNLFGIAAIAVGILYFIQISWSRILIKVIYWITLVTLAINTLKFLFSTGFSSDFGINFGAFFAVVILMMIVLERINSKRGIAFFYGLEDERMDTDAPKEGWICPECQNVNKYSIQCWNCDHPKPIQDVPVQKSELEDEEKKKNASNNKLDAFIEKQTEIEEKINKNSTNEDPL